MSNEVEVPSATPISKHKTSIVKATSTPGIELEVRYIDKESGDEVTENWLLVYDYRAIARLKESTGQDLLRPSVAWEGITSGEHFPNIIWAGLHRYHPLVTLDEIIDRMNPAFQAELGRKIFNYLFPGFLANLIEDAKKKAEAEAAGKDPNAPTASPSV